ncbi:MAG: 8-oxo-dGTP diphosphatase [Candidatus Cloacimonetes bacterium]|nr:8-oxo-dGTP diphosphatase [Candidatus Cloacimonadota bacterium]
MPPIEATLCYLEHDGQVLMLHRNSRADDVHYGKYNGLGGKLDPGESPLDCVLRELHEECGLRPGRIRFSGHIAFPAFDGSRDWSVFLYRAFEPQGTLSADPAEGALEWVPREQLLELPLWEGDRHFLPWVLADRRFMARFVYEAGVYRSHEVHFIDEDLAL